jgi:hypothetical protein
MKGVMLVAVLLASQSPHALAADSYSDIFSHSFKASVDAAMQLPTQEARSKALVEAMALGTDEEVFFVFPLLFPLPVLNSAKDAGVCLKEIEASLGNGKLYVAASAAEQASFPETHAVKIRSDTGRLIRCLHKYYKNGQLSFPAQQSNNSFKPNLLRYTKAMAQKLAMALAPLRKSA